MSPGLRLLLAHALTATAMSLPWPALLAATWSATSGDGWLGTVGASRMFPYIVLSAAAGALADRVRRTTVLRCSAWLRVTLLLGCAVAFSAGQLAVAVVLAVATVAAGTPAYPAAVAAMPGLGGGASDRLTELLVTVEVTAFVVGPAVGGLLLGAGHPQWSVAVAVALTAAALPLLAGLDTGPVAVSSGPAELSRLRTVLGSPGVPAAMGVVAVVNLVDAAASVGLLSLSERHWVAGDRGFGLATAALGLGSLSAPLVGVVLRLRPALLVTGAGLGLAGVAPGVLLATGPLAIAGGSATVVECVTTDVLQHAVPDRVRAFALGLTDSVMVLAAALGALLAPRLASATGPRVLFVGFALSLALTAVCAGPRARRDVPAPAEPSR